MLNDSKVSIGVGIVWIFSRIQMGYTTIISELRDVFIDINHKSLPLGFCWHINKLSVFLIPAFFFWNDVLYNSMKIWKILLRGPKPNLAKFENINNPIEQYIIICFVTLSTAGITIKEILLLGSLFRCCILQIKYVFIVF